MAKMRTNILLKILLTGFTMYRYFKYKENIEILIKKNFDEENKIYWCTYISNLSEQMKDYN